MVYRYIEEQDAKAFLEMMHGLDQETKRMLLEPDERTNDVESVRKMIKRKRECGHFFLIAEDGNEMAGMITAERGELRRIHHTAYIVTGIREKYRGQGIGTRFFKELDQWALENQIIRFELTVVADNEPAMHLYQKAGFKIEGTREQSMYIDGQYYDEYYMAKVFPHKLGDK